MDEEDKLPSVSKAKQELTFLTKNPLTALQKKLKSSVPKALEVMTNVVEDNTDKYSGKEKQDAAKFLIESYVKVTDAIMKDSMAKMVAEVKLKGLAAKPNLKDIDPEDKQPQAAFTLNILDPNKLDGEVEDSDVFDASNLDFSKKRG